jgi:hypothetical protein
VLGSVALQAALLFVGAVVLIYVGFVPLRAWAVLGSALERRRALAIASLVVAAAAASAVVYAGRDRILCPAGHGDADSEPTRTSTGKGGIKVVCTSNAGVRRDGSVFAGVGAWFGAAAVAVTLATLVMRGMGVPVPPPAPRGAMPVPGAPTDRRERRKERKAREHRERRGGGE